MKHDSGEHCQGATRAQQIRCCSSQPANAPETGIFDSVKSSACFYLNVSILCGARGLSRVGIPRKSKALPPRRHQPDCLFKINSWNIALSAKYKGGLVAEPELTEMRTRFLVSGKGGGLTR